APLWLPRPPARAAGPSPPPPAPPPAIPRAISSPRPRVAPVTSTTRPASEKRSSPDSGAGVIDRRLLDSDNRLPHRGERRDAMTATSTRKDFPVFDCDSHVVEPPAIWA